MDTKKYLSIFMSAIVAVCLISEIALSQEEEEIELTSLSCRDLLKMNGDEEDFTLVFFHGYMSGKNNDASFDPIDFAKATDNVRDYCISNPQESVISVFEKYRSSDQ